MPASRVWNPMVVLAIALLVVRPTLACRAGQQGPAGGPASPPSWRLVWHDEFDGAALDSTRWSRETGGNGWGNAERELYTDRVETVPREHASLGMERRARAFGNMSYA